MIVTGSIAPKLLDGEAITNDMGAIDDGILKVHVDLIAHQLLADGGYGDVSSAENEVNMFSQDCVCFVPSIFDDAFTVYRYMEHTLEIERVDLFHIAVRKQTQIRGSYLADIVKILR